MAIASSDTSIKTLQRKISQDHLLNCGEWVVRNCIHCDEPFQFLDQASVRGCRPTTCSLECKRAARPHKKRAAEGARSRTESCKVCKQQFTYTEKSKGRRRKFCSDPCKAEWKAAWLIVDRVANEPKYRAREAEQRSTLRYSAPLRTWECKFCGDKFESRSLHVRMTCSIVCGNAIRRLASSKPAGVAKSNRRRSLREKNKRRLAWMKGGAQCESFKRLEIFERDAWRCGLCGGDIDRELKFPHRASATVDHIIPISRGGSHTRANVQAAHFSCNSKKQDKVKHG